MSYLNFTGASIVAGVLAAGGLYLGSIFSFRNAWEWSQERSIQLSAVHDRWRNWQADRADHKAEREAIRQAERGPVDVEEEFEEEEVHQPGFFGRIFGFLRRRKPVEDDLEDVPAFQRMKKRSEAARRGRPAPRLPPQHLGAPRGHASRTPARLRPSRGFN